MFVFGMLFVWNGLTANAGNMQWQQLTVRNRSEWVYSDNGVRATGWRKVNGLWYYFGEAQDDSRGVMQIGWQQIGGKWYYLSESGGRTFGSMQVGWQKINGNWYYLEERGGERPLGSMYANETTPDGYFVGEDGAWISFSAPYANIVKSYSHGLTKDVFVGMHYLKYMDIHQDWDAGDPVRHDGYIEFKDVTVTAYTLYDKSMVEGYKIGQRIQLDGRWCTVISKSSYFRDEKIRKRVYVRPEDNNEAEEWDFWLEETDDGYLFYGYSDDIMDSKQIYRGSIYIKNDAKVAYFDEEPKVATMEEYMNFRGGDPYIYGYINMEENGLISDLFTIIGG